MAPRYLIVESRRAEILDLFATRVPPQIGLSIVYRARHAVLLASDPQLVTVLPNGCGAIFGSLFYRHGPGRRIEAIEPAEAERILATGGASLIDRYWGGYVALVDDQRGPRIIRDPSGALPCYFAGRPDCRVIGSDPAILAESGLYRPQVDWGFVSRYFYSGGQPSGRTGLVGLHEVQRGTAFQLLQDGISTDTLWTPWDHVRRGEQQSEHANAENLARVLQSTVGALSSQFDRIVLGVSGGLDSSIVAAALRAANRKLSCITLSTDDPDGDERYYARTLCEKLDTHLDERKHDLDKIDLGVSSVAHLPRPIGRLQAQAYDAAILEIARYYQADAIFTGNGGDNVFAFSYSASPVVDRYATEGLAFGSVKTLLDICKLSGASFWQALLTAHRIWRRPSYAYSWRTDPEFLHPAIAAVLDGADDQHPWLIAPRDALPGKSGHIALLLRIQQQLDGMDPTAAPPIVNPLMSQPVIECCLGIPSWQWVANGENRSIARQAFSNRLPQAIVSRQSKGGPDAFCQAIISRHRAAIRDRLLGGHLVEREIADPAALDAALSDDRPDLGGAHVRIMAFLDTEAWIDHWLAKSNAPIDREINLPACLS